MLKIFLCISLILIGCKPSTDVETGKASYYSDEFIGQITANGEKYDPAELTAAHRSHPFGTYLQVTNIENGKSVTVRVNDRGLYVEGRIIDLSKSAAQQLGLVNEGVVNVKIEIAEAP